MKFFLPSQSPKTNFPSIHSSMLKALYNLSSFFFLHSYFAIFDAWKKKKKNSHEGEIKLYVQCCLLSFLMFHSSMNFYWHLGDIVDDENYYIEKRERESEGCEGEEIVFELLCLAGCSATNLFMRWMAFIFIMRFILS